MKCVYLTNNLDKDITVTIDPSLFDQTHIFDETPAWEPASSYATSEHALSRKRKLHEEAGKKERLPHNFVLPTCFSGDINKKLKDKSTVLNENEYSAICREVASAIKQHTVRPSPEELALVSKKLIVTYPSLADGKDGEELAKVLLFFK